MEICSVFISDDIKNGVHGFGHTEIYNTIEELLENHKFVVLPPLISNKRIAYNPSLVFPTNTNVINIPDDPNKRIVCFGYSVVYKEGNVGPKGMTNPFDYPIED